MTTTNPTTAPLSSEREAEPYRDDVRESLDAAGWRETEEGCVVAPNGALWTETNDKLDSGVDAPDKAWSVSFDSGVPGPAIVAVALAASGVDVPAQLAELDRVRAENTRLRAERLETNGKLVELTMALRTAEKRHADLAEAMDALATAWSRPGMSGPSQVAGQHLAQVLAQVAAEATEAGDR